MSQRVSFIIPYFNSGETIDETIQSIFDQSYSDFDVWIINDGSTDEYSIKKLDEFRNDSKINVLDQQNAGPCVARNNAIIKCKGDVIIPLDADDKICRDTISRHVNIFMQDLSIGIIFGNINQFGEKNGIKVQQSFDIRKQLLWNQIAACCLIRKEVFESVGKYDEFLSKPGLEDWEFLIKVYCGGWKIYKVDSVLFEVRVNHDSRTFQVANKNIESIKKYVYSKHADLLATEYEKLFYDKKMILETPDYRLGNCLLTPYRIAKKIYNKKINK